MAYKAFLKPATSLLVVGFYFVGQVLGEPLFERVLPEESGLDFVNEFDEEGERSYLYQSGFACGAVVMGDVDGDGRVDLFFTGGAAENGLYLNRGGMKFEKSLAGEVIGGGENWASGAALMDLDNDGDLDLHVCNYAAPNQLFLNDGKGGFTDVTAVSGMGTVDSSLEALFADFDRDGDLDVYLVNNTLYLPKGRPVDPPYKMVDGEPVVDEAYAPHLMIKSVGNGDFTIDTYGRPDRFLINDGLGADGVPRFRDVTQASGIAGDGFGLSATLIDIDDDGWMDIFVANDFLAADRLWKNLGPGEDGVPRFQDATTSFLPQIAWSSMGAVSGDLDNDGYADLMVVDMASTTHFKSKISMGEMNGVRRVELETGWPRQAMRNHVFFGTGTPRYLEGAFFAGLASTDWSWAVKFADFDLDGLQDVVITNGHSRNFGDADVPFSVEALIGRTQFQIYKDSERLLEENLAFRNVGGRKFESAQVGWGLAHTGMSYAAATGDLDGDGDPELVVANLGEPVHLYRNESVVKGRFAVKLLGSRSNRFGVGARVDVLDSKGVRRSRWVTPQNGFVAQDDLGLLFGLGDGKAVSVEVAWPSGIRQQVLVKEGEMSLVVEEEGKVLRRERPELGQFVVGVAPDFVHEERLFDDYARQELLPGKLSQLGPCVVLGDVDGDGDEDVFVGGAARQAAGLYLNDGGGGFERSEQAVLEGFGKFTESADAVWFDADGDDDLDLYVVSGSVEQDAGHVFYRDRLYVNEGGKLSEAPEGSLPDLRDSGSCVAAADYDGDGDVDLFVGTRSLVGEYPLAPESRLLRNDGGLKFSEVVGAVAGAGMVTDAVWADVDGDKDVDLCVATEWGAVSIYLNEGGDFKSVRKLDGSGWWNCVEAVDVDGDGDLDLLAGNVGFNTKYGKSAELFYGDMDGSGKANIVEAKRKEGALLPVRGKSCSSHAMPALGEKFESYRQFASQDLVGIYTEDRVKEAQRFAADQFESGVWINRGERFEWMAFPGMAQISQVNAMVAGDFDGDGKLEVILAQNHDTREPETGLWRGGVGCHLEWNDGGFVEIPPVVSGIVLPGDTKAIVGFRDGRILAGQNNAGLLMFVPRGK